MNSVQDIWNAVLKILSNTLTPTAIQTWFSDCRPVEWNNGTMVLCVRNEFTQNIIFTRFGSVIKDAMHDLFSSDCELRVLAGDDELQAYMETKKPSGSDMMLPEMEPMPPITTIRRIS